MRSSFEIKPSLSQIKITLNFTQKLLREIVAPFNHYVLILKYLIDFIVYLINIKVVDSLKDFQFLASVFARKNCISRKSFASRNFCVSRRPAKLNVKWWTVYFEGCQI